MDTSQDRPVSAPDPDDRDQTLLQELVWSAALIGGVSLYLVLLVQFAS